MDGEFMDGQRKEIEIVCVRSEAEADAVRALARAFKAWNYAILADMTDVVDAYFNGHDFEGHLARLLVDCNPPDGECLLARLDGEPVGIVTLRRRTTSEGELNRLFVQDAARGTGAGRALVTTLIARARALGYSAILLSTVNRFDAALGLFRSLGFVDDPRGDPPDVAVQVDMRLNLT